jgi:hypothetical protein
MRIHLTDTSLGRGRKTALLHNAGTATSNDSARDNMHYLQHALFTLLLPVHTQYRQKPHLHFNIVRCTFTMGQQNISGAQVQVQNTLHTSACTGESSFCRSGFGLPNCSSNVHRVRWPLVLTTFHMQSATMTHQHELMPDTER